jgi:DNA-binding response OmpR family regulator
VADAVEKANACGAAGLRRHDGTFEPVPALDTTVHRDDAVIVITQSDDLGDSVHKLPTGKTILLADDHRALRLLFTRKLASAGHDVIQAATGSEALRLARSQAPSLIVLDVNMPDQNGYEVCTALRQDERFADTPIIMYSGEDTDEFIERGRASGADMCIRKTSKSSELLTKIEEAFSLRTSAAQTAQTGTKSADESAVALQEPSLPAEPIDIDRELAEIDAEVRNEVVQAVLDETPRLMDDIRRAITRQDGELLRRAAHSLKGSLLIFGDTSASASAASLEMAGRNGDLAHAEQLHGELIASMDPLLGALKRHLSC